MGNYKTKTTVTDFGPYVTALLLNAGGPVAAKNLAARDFEVYVERKSRKTGKILKTKEFFQWDEEPAPAAGTRRVIRAYPCDSAGVPCDLGEWVALELETDALGKTIDGNTFSQNDYRITYRGAEALLKERAVFDTYDGGLCPQLEGWANVRVWQESAGQAGGAKARRGELRLSYGYYTPPLARSPERAARPLPLVVWLHGAGEGGTEPEIAYTGNKAVHLSSKEIQDKLGGQAWVLVPQCPTVWMDDGIEQLGRSNESIYTAPLKACIDEFIQERQGLVDVSRIYLGGCSNGGFMTVRMAIDYPGFWAAIFPVCEAFFEENLTPERLKVLEEIPCWLVHARGDALVDPRQTVIPLYQKLKAAGADNIHLTYFDSMDAECAPFWKNEKLPPHIFDHGVWVNVYNDQCTQDFDGSPVLCGEKPVTLFEWLGQQKSRL